MVRNFLGIGRAADYSLKVKVAQVFEYYQARGPVIGIDTGNKDPFLAEVPANSSKGVGFTGLRFGRGAMINNNQRILRTGYTIPCSIRAISFQL